MITVNLKTYSPPPVSKKEILRYMGVRKETTELEELVSACIGEAESVLGYKLCYCEVPISIVGDTVDFGFASARSHGLRKQLSGCHSAIVFAATVGIGIDRLIAKSALVSQVRELAFSAIGTERIEALCDRFCNEKKKELEAVGMGLGKRFSPGYSDLPLSFQNDIFAVLGCSKVIGLTLNECLLMTPKKSVTAIVGIYNL